MKASTTSSRSFNDSKGLIFAVFLRRRLEDYRSFTCWSKMTPRFLTDDLMLFGKGADLLTDLLRETVSAKHKKTSVLQELRWVELSLTLTGSGGDKRSEELDHV